MSNQYLTFNFATQSVRVVMIEGAPWFVAADVCAVLGLINVTRAIERLDGDEKSQVIDSNTLNSNQGRKINDLLNVVNESGLYSLILTSRKPEAKAFKKWITSEVLPTLRQQGQYRMANVTEPVTITMSQNQLTDLIERCIERGVAAGLRAGATMSATVTESTRPRTARENFSEWEKAEILRLNKLGVSALEVAELLYRPVSSIRSFLWRHRRGALL
ncbi:MAG: hypothetical protein JNM60_12885 [Candidatus Competibacteraceae bacterium]|nr:hypothetical protein [Candidatus Competibacteraceae bacterium]